MRRLITPHRSADVTSNTLALWRMDAGVYATLVAPTYPAATVLAASGTESIAKAGAASGGDGVYTYSLHPDDTLPAGYSVNASTGDIEGTAGASAEDTTVRVRVTDGQGTTADTTAFRVGVGVALPVPLVLLSMDSATISGGTYQDQSGNANHATINGAPSAVTALVDGEAVNFAADADFLELGRLLPSAVTVVATVRLTGAPGIVASVVEMSNEGPGNADGFGLVVLTDRKPRAHVSPGASAAVFATGPTALDVGTNYVLSAQYDSSGPLELFVDGASVASNAVTGSIGYGATTTTRISRRSFSTSGYFPGDIDEWALFDQKLTADQQITAYLLSKAGTPIKTWVGL